MSPGGYNWDCRQVNVERPGELQHHNATRWSKDGVRAIDESPWGE